VHNPNLNYGSMIDQEGNVYKTIVIGNQEWMAENLNTSIYRNGETIAHVTDEFAWENLLTGAWCYYGNYEEYECPYGKLYNWFTVDDPRNLCPTGWHVPTNAEWMVLTNYLDDADLSAWGKMKSTTGWLPPNTGATNESGFSGLPGGIRIVYGNSIDAGYYGSWWSSSEFDTNLSWYRYLGYLYGNANRYYDLGKRSGFSVRCLRD
jgi:uncharacterized protein (TIGR02145 family)